MAGGCGVMTNPMLEGLSMLSQRPPGYWQLLQFCRRVEAGKTPDQETLDDLAKAFRELIDKDNLKVGLAAFAGAMELKGKPGRRESNAVDDNQYTAALKSYFLEFEGVSPSEAVTNVAAKIYKEESFVWRARKKHKGSAKSMARSISKFERDVKSVMRFEQMVESMLKKKD
jgi:hypothetical protein